MAYALQQLINGITLGMIYGLIAVGYTMVYGIIGMINFAHGDVFMVGAFLSLMGLTLLGGLGLTSVPLALAISLIAAALISAVYGWTIERVAYRPLRGSFRLAPLISAIGMSIVLQNFVQVSQGARDLNLQPLIPGVHLHHERWDGKGYPLGLAQNDIPLIARIVAVADTYDAMTSDRAYRRALPHEVTFNEIERCSGTQFDANVAHAFLEAIEELRAQKLELGEWIPE